MAGTFELKASVEQFMFNLKGSNGERILTSERYKTTRRADSDHQRPDEVTVPQEGEASPTEPQRWARVPPGKAWKRPGLPREWVRVLQHHPEGSSALPGYVWLDTPAKPLHVAAHQLEFTEDPP